MPSLAKEFSDVHDRAIFRELGETLVYGSVAVTGIFFKRYRVIELDNGAIASFDLSFDAQFSDVNTLVEGDTVEIFADDESQGTFKFRRHFPEGGDESGKVTLDLATV